MLKSLIGISTLIFLKMSMVSSSPTKLPSFVLLVERDGQRVIDFGLLITMNGYQRNLKLLTIMAIKQAPWRQSSSQWLSLRANT